jgi:replication factor C large subunit
MADWTETYRPETLSEVRGNDSARDELREWAETWDDHRESVICHGSPGVGKTSAAHALAADLGWPVMELNASDSRTRDVVERIAGEAAKSGTLTGGSEGRRLVILDEADNFHGNADYGGARAVTDVIKDAEQPVVLIANEFYEMSRGLRNNCREIEFRDVSSRSIVPVLRDICRKENVEFEDEALQAIADQTSGDLRSAINDLQALAEGRDRIAESDVVTDERDTTTGIFDFLDDLFKEHGAQEALQSSYDVDETPDELLSWIEDNVPKEYERDELADAFQHLSTSDRWLGRVRATQNYSFWRYAGDAMTAGVAASRQGQKGGWTRYGPPSFRSKLGRSKGTRATRDAIARRIAERKGLSVPTARRVVLPFLGAMIHHCKPRELSVQVAAAYELDADELSFVTGSGADTNKVQSIIEDAERAREESAVEGSQGAFEGTIEDEFEEVDTPAESADTDDEDDQRKDKSDGISESDESTGGQNTETTETADDQSGLDEFV